MSAALLVASRPPADDTMHKIKERLGELPPRPKQIAEFLIEHEQAGRRRSAFGCPLNGWLARDLPAGYLLRLDDDAVGLVDGQDLLRAGPTVDSCPVPEAVTEFLQQFDAGRYPDLDVTELGLPSHDTTPQRHDSEPQ